MGFYKTRKAQNTDEMGFYKTRKAQNTDEMGFYKTRKANTRVKRAFKKYEKLQTPINSKIFIFALKNSADALVLRLSKQFNISLDLIQPPNFMNRFLI